LIPNLRDCYDINQDDHATVLHSVSLKGLLWKRKRLYQASLTSVPSLHQWWNVMHVYSSVLHTTVHQRHRRFLWRKVYFQDTQSRSWVRGVRNWSILINVQILICAIIMIMCMRRYIIRKRPKFLPKNERTFKEKLPTF